MNYMAFFIYSEAFILHLVSLVLTINPSLVLGLLIITSVLIFVLVTLFIKGIKSTAPFKKKEEPSLFESLKNNFIDREQIQADPIRELPKDISFNEKLLEINKEIEPFGFAYDLETDAFFSLMNPWQREFGYCRFYDETAPTLSMIIDCEPIYFEYDGKSWLIEFWKGQYGITTGAEIGIYNTSQNSIHIPGVFNGMFYHAVKDEERLEMAFTLLKNNKLLTKSKGLHWWLTSFKLGEFSYPEELEMYIEISFPNATMRSAFVEGLMDAGYSQDEFTERNNIVYIRFDVPHTKQPYTRTDFVVDIMQDNNKRNTELFNSATNNFTSMVDKLYSLKEEHPKYYKEALQIGKPKQLFSIYKTIKYYLE